MQFIQATCTPKSFLINCPRPCSQPNHHITELYIASFWHWDLSEILHWVELCVQFPRPARLHKLCQGQRYYMANIAQACGESSWVVFGRNRCPAEKGTPFLHLVKVDELGFEGKSKSSHAQALKAFQVTSDVQGNYYWVVLDRAVRRKMLLLACITVTWK